jgi:tRNA (cytidine/uridine-2'-O-)-methyltransferase
MAASSDLRQSDGSNPGHARHWQGSAPQFSQQIPPKLPQIVYCHPEIPGNTGAAIRLCAVTGSRLHLIEPLGFDLSTAKLRRAGLDYHDLTAVRVYRDFDSFLKQANPDGAARILAFRSQAERLYSDFSYRASDFLLFGCESSGLPAEIYTRKEISQQLALPMLPHLRSLNVTNTASIALYESWRQLGFPV